MFNKNLLKRNDAKIKSMLKEQKGSIECSDTLYVVFPQRYIDKDLGSIGNKVEVFAVCLVMDKNYNYTVFKLPNTLTFLPTSIDTISVDGKDYMKLECRGPEFISSTEVIDTADPVFIMLEDWVIMGNYPFYVTKDEIVQIFAKSTETTSSKFGRLTNRIATLLAIAHRDKTGKIEARHINNPVNTTWVGLIDATSIYNNNLARIMGGYMNKGITGGILDENPVPTELEKVLRI